MSALVDPRTLRARRILTCIGLAAAPILLAISFGLQVSSSDDAAKELAGIAADRTQFQISAVIGVLGFGAFVLGASALAQLARARGAAWVTTGAAMVAVGGFSMACGFWSYATAGHLLTMDGIDGGTATDILDNGNDSAFVGLGWMLGMAVLVGLVVVGVGLLRAGTVPRWLAALLIVSPFVAFLGDDGVVGALLLLPMIVACALLARAVLALPLGTEPAPEAGSMPSPRIATADESVQTAAMQ